MFKSPKPDLLEPMSSSPLITISVVLWQGADAALRYEEEKIFSHKRILQKYYVAIHCAILHSENVALNHSRYQFELFKDQPGIT